MSRKAPVCCKRPMEIKKAVPQGSTMGSYVLFFQCRKCGKWKEYDAFDGEYS